MYFVAVILLNYRLIWNVEYDNGVCMENTITREFITYSRSVSKVKMTVGAKAFDSLSKLFSL